MILFITHKLFYCEKYGYNSRNNNWKSPRGFVSTEWHENLLKINSSAGFFQDLPRLEPYRNVTKIHYKDELLQASYNSSIQNYLKSIIQQILVVASKKNSVKTPTKFSFRENAGHNPIHLSQLNYWENVFKEIVFLSINAKREMNINISRNIQLRLLKLFCS